MITDWHFFAAAIPAVILVGLSKGGLSGLGMLSMPLMTLVMGPVQAAGILLPILIVQDMTSIWSYRKSYDVPSLIVLVPSAFVGILFGYFFAASLSDAAVALALGLISMVFSLRQLIQKARGIAVIPSKPGTVFGWLCGIVCGFTSMVAQAGGPPFQVYMMPQRLPRDVFVGTGVLLFALINLIKVPPFILLGQLNERSIASSVVLMPLAVASTWAGVMIVRRIRGDGIYVVASVLLLLVGTWLTWRGIAFYW